jgi:hypothetical protein
LSFWVHAFCKKSIADVTADELREGIAERLELLTYLFCPDDEEPPKKVIARLRVERRSPKTFLIHLNKSGPFINATRHGRDAIEEVEAILPRFGKLDGLPKVKKLLASATEDMSFDLKASHVRGMGFPVAIAAAATLVARADGVIQSGTYSWMVPSGREVDLFCST